MGEDHSFFIPYDGLFSFSLTTCLLFILYRRYNRWQICMKGGVYTEGLDRRGISYNTCRRSTVHHTSLTSNIFTQKRHGALLF